MSENGLVENAVRIIDSLVGDYPELGALALEFWHARPDLDPSQCVDEAARQLLGKEARPNVAQ